LLDRHESLRTSFTLLNDEPVQRIHEQVEFKIEYYEASRAEETILQDFVRPFDLSQAPMLRVGVVKVPGERYVLLTDMHHIISDGFSRRILTDDFMALARREHLPVLRIQYKDFAQWQNRVEQKETVKDREAYWLREFAGEIPVLDLPTDYARPPVQSFEGSSVDFVLGVEETGALRRMVSDEGVTLYMILSAVCYVLLSKLSGQEDIVMGTPVLGRRHADLENVIGMFVNTLALRNNPGGNKSVKEFLEELRGRTLGSFENQEYQFEESWWRRWRSTGIPVVILCLT
jgi:tyrocidine synthetase-3